MSEVVTTTPPSLAPADPRPRLVVEDGTVLLTGSRCGSCGYAMSVKPPRCPVCAAASPLDATFGPGATVFSATVLRIPVPGRTPPYGLAYVDVDEGPRMLAHVAGPLDGPLAPGTRVRLVGWNDLGDPMVAVEVES